MSRAASFGATFRSGEWITLDRVRGYAILFLVLTTIGTLALWTSGDGLLDMWGRPIGTDFANPYSAGRMALEGRAADAYDYPAQFAVQQALLGGGEDQPFYGWPYPPILFLLVAPLALLPYFPALIVWLGATGALYLYSIWTILPHRLALLAAAAFPAVFLTVGHGQNALLTAGLLGLGLALLERRPLLSGVLLGCLAYKPHLGLVLPLILVCGGHWRACAGAAFTVVTLSAVSVAIFGLEPWQAFVESRTLTRVVVLEQVATGWFKIQSVFSAVRGLGGAVELAYLLQVAVSLGVLASLGLAWLRGGGERAKAAACIGALIVTPYVLDYDLTVLAPALGFLVARGVREGFQPYEKTLIAACWLLPMFARPAAQYLHLPLGSLLVLMLFATTIKAALEEARKSPPAVAVSV